MFNSRDECMEAFVRNPEMLRYDVVSIFHRPSTETYRYSPDQRRTSNEELYAVLERHGNAWLFKRDRAPRESITTTIRYREI
jgi:hypothetical protein